MISSSIEIIDGEQYVKIELLDDEIKQKLLLEKENQKYKEVIDKIKEEINNNKYYTGNTRRDIKTRKLIIEHIETALISKNKILEILKEVE